MNVFTAVRKDSRDWWYFKQLRREGKIKEAREKENKSTKNTISNIRKAYYVTVGRSGHTIYFPSEDHCTHRIEGYKRIDHPEIQLMIARGVPVIDTMTINDDNIVKTLFISLIAIPPEVPEKKYGSLNRESLEWVASEYKKLGATIYNIKGV